VDEARVKRLLAEMLVHRTAGSILHLLAEVLRESFESPEDEGLRDAVGALFVFGVGLDSVLPRGT
jgi:hypothetical protein